jgi:hypothetical protein
MYQEEAERQEKQEYFDDCVKAAVEKEVERIINSATCFDCDNPLVILETDDGITVKSCEKCSGLSLKIDTPFMQSLVDMDAVIGKINGLTRQINGRG